MLKEIYGVPSFIMFPVVHALTTIPLHSDAICLVSQVNSLFCQGHFQYSYCKEACMNP